MKRLSYSQMKLFKSCPRKWYYKYVLKMREPENKYLHFGSAVHDSLENIYSDGEALSWIQVLQKYPLAEQIGAERYDTAIKNGENAQLWNRCKTEEKMFLRINADITFVGYIDIITDDEQIWDWKTGKYTPGKAEEYREQLRCYAYLYWKKYGRMPKSCHLFFVDSAQTYNAEITEDEAKAFEQEIIEYAQKMDAMTADGERNQTHCWAFGSRCAFYDHCHALNDVLKYTIHIKGNTAFLDGDITDTLEDGLKRALSYDLKDKYWIQQSVLKRHHGLRPKNYDDIGTKHLYIKRHHAFGIGHIRKVKQVLQQYAQHLGKQIDVKVVDHRSDVQIWQEMPTSLKSMLRPYQEEAVQAFFDNDCCGYLEMATGSGKTITTAEIIRRLDVKTLWIIDRKELLWQTKEVFEEELGIECGVLTGSTSEGESKQIVLATIQTLKNRVNKKNLQRWFDTFNLVICDEAHHASCESYQKVFKWLTNATYRLGTSGTVRRDDGNEMILESLMGDIVYRISAADLIEQGYLQKPRIIFHGLMERGHGLEYHEVYKDHVVDNHERNQSIISLVDPHKRTLILVKQIEHGKYFNQMLKDGRFIHGKTAKETRKKALSDFKAGKTQLLIGTMQIFSEGIDIPELDCIINAAGNKGEVKTIQSLGRVLRKSSTKKGCEYHDFLDDCNYLREATEARIQTFINEGYEIQKDI